MKRLFLWLLGLVAGLAIADQLNRAPSERAWHGQILFVPYDFRPPTLSRIAERLWNPNDDRVLVPTVVGIGWTINVYQLIHRLELLIA